MKGEINLIKDKDLNKLQDLKESLEIDAKPKRNIKRVLTRELIDNESFEDFNKYDIDIDDEIVMPVITEEPESVISLEPTIKETKTKKAKQSTDDKFKVLLDEQYDRLDRLITVKLENYNYRLYCSFKAELARWYEGYYDQIK